MNIKYKVLFILYTLTKASARAASTVSNAVRPRAIHVRNGKSPHHQPVLLLTAVSVRPAAIMQRKIHIDSLDILNNYAYTVALPAPSLYAQFNNWMMSIFC